MKQTNKSTLGTFSPNKIEPIHRWYSYLEGYSSILVDSIIQEIGPDKLSSVYDPFCGTGTTSLVAAKYGVDSYYSETNPFMRLVIDSKINNVKKLRENGIGSVNLKKLLNSIRNYNYSMSFQKINYNGFEKFFDEDVLEKLLNIKTIISNIPDIETRQIALILLCSIVVQSSKMIRQGDLRVAKKDEKAVHDKDVFSNYITKLQQAIADIDDIKTAPIYNETHCLSDDAKDNPANNLFDCVITSPPYLNGTNYIRNTKLELKLADFIMSETDLPQFHSKGIIAGINNVSKRRSCSTSNPYAQDIINKLEKVAYDKRIPIMIAGYFNDMEKVIERLSYSIKNNGYFIMDIGDSQFAGIHVPTHEILSQICKNYGFELYEEQVLRNRRSKNNMVLSQRLLKFKLHKDVDHRSLFYNQAVNFIENMPYHNEPYNSRNWGDSLHSLCSYHGKLKPSIAHFLVKEFTQKGDLIVDPLCGVGTIPLEACLLGRIGVGNDLSKLAYVVTKAKIEKPSYDGAMTELYNLQQYIETNIHVNNAIIKDDIKKCETFGFNGSISSYYHPDTLKEILWARKYFLEKKELSAADCMVFSCLLHILHGNRPYALSRISHPLTPYRPKGDFLYKNVIEHIKAKIDISYKNTQNDKFTKGFAILGDYKDLTHSKIHADAIITSPPFAGSIRFYMQNWLRLWLCGWDEENYKEADTLFLDQKQNRNFDVYLDFFETCAKLLKPKGKMILHLGKTAKIDMATELAQRAQKWFEEVYRGTENVTQLEKHGVKDKGGTIEHQYLFLMKK